MVPKNSEMIARYKTAIRMKQLLFRRRLMVRFNRTDLIRGEAPPPPTSERQWGNASEEVEAGGCRTTPAMSDEEKLHHLEFDSLLLPHLNWGDQMADWAPGAGDRHQSYYCAPYKNDCRSEPKEPKP